MARNAHGMERLAQLRCPNVYHLSVNGVLMAVDHLMSQPGTFGFRTPSMLMGAQCVEHLPGVSPIVVT